MAYTHPPHFSFGGHRLSVADNYQDYHTVVLKRDVGKFKVGSTFPTASVRSDGAIHVQHEGGVYYIGSHVAVDVVTAKKDTTGAVKNVFTAEKSLARAAKDVAVAVEDPINKKDHVLKTLGSLSKAADDTLVAGKDAIAVAKDAIAVTAPAAGADCGCKVESPGAPKTPKTPKTPKVTISHGLDIPESPRLEAVSKAGRGLPKRSY